MAPFRAFWAPRSDGGAARLLTMTAALMMAGQTAGKAARDALFLDEMGIAALPTMFVVAAAVSIATVPLAGRLLGALGPARLVPAAFASSVALLAIQSTLATVVPTAIAVTLYLHVAVVNVLLISWFWSLTNERFDPRTAKRALRSILAGASIGALLGGLAAERVAHAFGLRSIIGLVAAIHAGCAVAAAIVSRPMRRDVSEPTAERAPTGLRLLKQSSYLRDVALLVAIGSVVAAVLDYVFMSRAVAAFARPAALVRFFAIFYATTSVAAFLIQAFASRALLARLGIARTISLLPGVILGGSLAVLAFSGLPSAVLLRGVALSVERSAFRSGYELLFNPLPPREKRRIKTVLDVGFERLGDALGGALLALVVVMAGASTHVVLPAFAIALSLVTLALASRLHDGYVTSLERSLRARTVDLDASDVHDGTTQSVLLSIRGLGLPPSPRTTVASNPTAAAAAAPADSGDHVAQRLASLRSTNPEEVRAALLRGPLDAPLVGTAIALLAWDAVAAEADKALRGVAAVACDELVAALLSPDQEFAVRRRLPRILGAAGSESAAAGLLRGLDDARFEVRYRCGRALSRMQLRSALGSVDSERVLAAVRREVSVGRGIWESQSLLDAADDPDDASAEPFVDEFLGDRANRSLEHVFTLLSLAFPRQALHIAFRALHTDDKMLRGTALEYLESALPEDVRQRLWPFLDVEQRPNRSRAERPPDEVLDALLRSNESVLLRLEELRRNAQFLVL